MYDPIAYPYKDVPEKSDTIKIINKKFQVLFRVKIYNQTFQNIWIVSNYKQLRSLNSVLMSRKLDYTSVFD